MALMRTAKSCRSDAPMPASSLREEAKATVSNKPGHRGEREVSRKTIARGMPGRSGVTVVTMLVCFFISHARPRAHRAPGIPCALCLSRGTILQSSGASRRENAESCLKLGRRHCERSEAIHLAAQKEEWIASSRSLSSGARSRDPLARNDGLGAGSPNPSCPRLSRASTSYFPWRCKAWMAGTNPAMTAEPGYWTISLRQQHRVRAVHGFGAVHHRLLQRCGLHRNIFGKEPRQRDIARRIAACFAEIARGERLAGQHAAAKRRSEQPQVRRRAGQRVVGRGSDPLQQPPAGALERGQRVAQLCARRAEGRIVGGLDALDDAC